MRRMSRGERKRWRAASSLHDLGRLTAAWLEGGIASQPGYAPDCGPDLETEDLIPVLARANRAGYVTAGSQPGVDAEIGTDGANWTQRAAVEGWMTPRHATELAEAATGAGLIAITHPVLIRRLGRREPGWIDVTRRNGQVVTGFGRQRRRREVEFGYAECGASAVDAVLAASHLTLAAPDYGTDQRVWELLDRWATA